MFLICRKGVSIEATWNASFINLKRPLRRRRVNMFTRFYKIKELLETLEIVHLDKVNPPAIEVFRALFSEDSSADAASYYITTDIVWKQWVELCRMPINEYIDINPPGMLMYDIITELPVIFLTFC